MRALLAATLALSLAARPALPCAVPRLHDKALTPDGTVIPSGGGVVIATINGFDGGDDDDGGRGVLKLVAGDASVVLKREYIAPALTVIVAQPQANRGIELVRGDGKTLLKLRQGDVIPKHAAPKLVKAVSTLAPTKPDPRMRWSPTSKYTIELAEEAPDDVLALVVMSGNQGIAWATPQKGQKSYGFYAGGKRCSPGAGAIVQGTRVTVAWLDVGGRLSLASKEIKVGVSKDTP